MRYLLFLLAFTAVLFSAEEWERQDLIRGAGSPEVIEGQQTTVIEGITLVSGGTEITTLPRRHGVSLRLHTEETKGLKSLLEEYLNHPLSVALISNIRKTIIDYYREHLSEYVAVVVPVQTIVNGVIFFEVLEGRVSEVTYKGQKWSSKRVLANAIDVHVGDPLIESEFLNSVTWANRNPFHHSQLILIPGKKAGEADVEFVTKDRFPVRFYAGGDNTGVQITSPYRMYAGCTWGDAFCIGDLLSYQYTASPDFYRFQSHMGSYTSFLPWRHTFNLLGVYATIFPNVPDFMVAGTNIQGSGRYQVPFFPLYGNLRHYMEFGFDYKYITSNSFFVGDITQASATNQAIVVAQFLASYQMEANFYHSLFTAGMQMVFSPFTNWFPYQNSADYDIARAGSQVRYTYWKGDFSYLYRTDQKISYSAWIRGQLATGALPTSEQFGLGGMHTIRGYYEVQFVGDNAFCMNLEMYSPPVAFFKGEPNEFSALVFLDYGYAYNYVVTDPVFSHQNLLGIGPGLRYSISTYFTGRADYGFQVLASPQDARIGRWHFSVTASY